MKKLFKITIILLFLALTLQNCAPIKKERKIEIKEVPIIKKVKVEIRSNCYKTVPNYFKEKEIYYKVKCLDKKERKCYFLLDYKSFLTLKNYIHFSTKCLKEIERYVEEDN